MDKRHLSGVFRDRLKLLCSGRQPVGIRRSGRHRPVGAFATSVGRLHAAAPRRNAAQHRRRAQGVARLAVGLSQDEGLTGEIRESLEIEEGSDDLDHTLLARWHAEATGTKIRYVPAGIPDLLRTEALIDYEAEMSTAAARRRPARRSTASNITAGQRPTWRSACPADAGNFARGLGVWSGFPAAPGASSFEHMAVLLDELYPTFRMFLYDGRVRYSVPYTISGPIAPRSMSATCIWC